MAELRQWDGTQWITVTDEAHRADAGDPHGQYVLESALNMDALLDADTTTTAPAAGNVLTWNGTTNWVPQAPAAVAMNDLTDADTVTLPATPGDGLIWDGTNWVPGAPVSQGITPLAPVRVASNATGVIASPPAAIDGITMVAGDRVLVKNQTNAVENGIYTYGATLTRATDANTEGSLVPGNSVLVQEGVVNGGVSFLVALESADLPWTPGTDEDRWYAAISKMDMQAGAGLSIAGKVLNVGQGAGIVVGADDVALDTTFTDGRYSLAAHAHTMDSLTDADTSTTAPAVGDGLQWDGTNWVPAAPAAGAVLPLAGAGLTGGVASYDVVGGTGITVAADLVSLDKAYTDTLYSPVTHAHNLDSLTDADTTTTAPTAGQQLGFDGTNWVPVTPAAGVTDHGLLTGLTDNDHPQYPQWAIANTAPAAPTAGMFWTVIP